MVWEHFGENFVVLRCRDVKLGRAWDLVVVLLFWLWLVQRSYSLKSKCNLGLDVCLVHTYLFIYAKHYKTKGTSPSLPP